MKQPKNNIQAVLYCLLIATKERKPLSTFNLIDATSHLGISQRIAEIRQKGIDVKCSMRSKKNRFGNVVTYGLFFIPSNQIKQDEELYSKLSNQ